VEKTRLELLQEIVENKPEDTFARYGLAMELATAGDPAAAWQHFDYLLTHHPEYSPAYYHAAKLLAGQARREEAQKVLAKGIEVTARQGNLHAQSELQAALEELVGGRR
jgi:Tfp pilus assembly protein PilF